MACPSNPSRYYTYIDVGGLARSDDDGQSWRMLHGSLPAREANYQVRGLLVDPRDADTVLIATGSQWTAPEGIYLSHDAGVTWRKTLTAQFMGNGPDRWAGFLLARDPKAPDVIVAASEGTGVFRSTDNGRSWALLGQTGLHPTDLKIDRTQPQRLWLCAQPFKDWVGGKQGELAGGFFRSEDGGTHWTPLAASGPSEILQDPRESGRLYGIVRQAVQTSTDGGKTWQPFADGLPPHTSASGPADDEFQSLAAGPDFVLTASTKGTFYRLPSGQTHWQKLDRQGVSEIYEGQEWFRHRTGGMGSALANVTVDPHDPAHWFFTDWYAIYQTRDAGRHWALSMDGIEDTVVHTIVQDPTDPAIVHLGMADDGYFRSTDGGRRFELRDSGISNNIKCIAPAPKQPRRVYAVGPQTWEWYANQVFVSSDRGQTWTRSPMTGLPDMKDARCNTIAADPRDPATAYLAVSGKIGTGGGLYRSTDGGRTWASLSAGLPAGVDFYRDQIWGGGPEVAAGPDGSLLTVSAKTGLAYHLAPTSSQWEKCQNELGSPQEVAADPFHPGRFYIPAQSGGLWRTDDGGGQWRPVSRRTIAHVAVDQAVPDRIAAGTEDGIILSRDGGHTWADLDKRLPYRTGNLVAFAGRRLLAGSGGSGAFWMPLTTQDLKTVRARAPMYQSSKTNSPRE